MKLLFICTNDDGPHLDKFARLPALIGHQVAVSRSPAISTSSGVALLAKSVKADAVICSSAEILKLVLESQYDYIPPNTRRGVTLDDYAGSLLTLHAIPNFTPVLELLVLNPPEQLYTVPYASFVFERFIQKLTNPSAYLPSTNFTWRAYDPNVDDVSDIRRTLNNADLLAVDIETAIGDPDRRINCVGYCAYDRRTHTTACIVIPFTSWAAVCFVREINANKVPKIFQNGLYDNSYFLRFGVPVSYWLHDTQHLFHSWLSELPKRLDFIAAFSIRTVRYWKDDGSTGSLSDYYRYNALDCWATLNSYLGIIHQAPDWAIQNYLIEFPLVFPCLHCAMEGFKIDLEKMSEVQQQKIADNEKDLARLRYLISSPGFNPNSPPQTASLFKILGLRLPTTGKGDMLKAKASSPFNEFILDFVTRYRETGKLISIQVNPEKVWCGRIFWSLNPAGTDTGRLASKESAFWCGVQIQNITRGDTVKQCYVSDDGWLLCEIDKAQSEARCVGYLSGETKLITLVESDKDYHSWNAQEFFGVPYESIYVNGKTVDKVLRDLSKRTNHGANYNMGANVMLETMGPKNVLRAKKALRLPLSYSFKRVCEFLLERYSATYPRVKGLWYTSIVKRITLSGKLVSSMGWTRRFFGSPAKNKRDLNAAVAHEPQNLSVGIVNREFFAIWYASLYGELKGIYRIKAQIHDSILGQYKQGSVEVPELIRSKYMNTTIVVEGADGVKRNMFIPSEVSAGKRRWSELK